jgi:hypothetical protein
MPLIIRRRTARAARLSPAHAFSRVRYNRPAPQAKGTGSRFDAIAKRCSDSLQKKYAFAGRYGQSL